MKSFALSKERILAISKFDALYEDTQRWDIFIKCHCCDWRRRNEESGLFNSSRRSQIVRYCIHFFVKYFQFNATVNDEVREINMFNIHAKAFSEQADYIQRINANI